PGAGTVLAGVGEIPPLAGRDGADDQPDDHHYPYVPHDVSPWVLGHVSTGGQVGNWVAGPPGDSECAAAIPVAVVRGAIPVVFAGWRIIDVESCGRLVVVGAATDSVS